MDNNDGKKKESIDEILSDLNGLLNKMPSILDGIKMPDLPPADFSAADKREPQLPADAPEPEAAPEPAPEVPPQPAPEADKTVVIEPLSSLPEGGAAPEAASPAPADADKTVILEPFSALPEGAPVPEAAEPAVAEPAASGPADAQPEPSAPAPEPEAVIPAPAELKALESTRDFGIPDIDALMQLSAAEQPAAPAAEQPAGPASQPEVQAPQAMPEAGIIPSSVRNIEEGVAEPSDGELAEFERQLTGAAQAQPEQPAAAEAAIPDPFAMPSGEADQSRPEVEASLEAAAQPEAPAPAVEIQPEAPAAAPEIQLEVRPEEQALQPEAPREQQAAEAAQPEAMPASDTPAIPDPFAQAAAELQVQPAAEPAPEPAPQPAAPAPEPSLELQAQTMPVIEPSAPSGIELSPSVSLGSGPAAAPEAENTLQFGLPKPDAAAQQGLVIETSASVFSQPEQPAAQPAAEETLVVAPPAASSGDEEKTVIYQPSAPGVTSRSQAGDLAGLAARQVPEGIPAERLRGAVFMYAAGEQALCASVLAELDSICLKSATKPMFIKRVSVRECEPDVNANFVLQSVTDSGAHGLVCLGGVPQEKVYEIDSAFGQAGAFFRHYDSSTFSHSAALDLVIDLILR